MTSLSIAFNPPTGRKALLEQIYEIKFSKHVPLVVVLLSMIYTVYRTNHYLGTAFHLDWWISVPTSAFIELLILGAAAALFIALRAAFISHLTGKDIELSQWGVYLGFVALGLAFVALLGLAGADAWAVTNAAIPAGVMVLIQATQMLFICGFIINATIDERDKLRTHYADYERTSAAQAANECPYCHKEVAPNNRKRHIDSCPVRPTAA